MDQWAEHVPNKGDDQSLVAQHNVNARQVWGPAYNPTLGREDGGILGASW